MPLALKIVIIAVLAMIVVGAIVGPSVYFGLAGEQSDRFNVEKVHPMKVLGFMLLD